MPRECLKIIESKSKVRQSRAKAVVAKVGMSSSTPAISSEVAELKDMVRALLLDKKNQSSALTSPLTPSPVKVVEPNYVTYGGTHSYQNCPATSGNAYRDNNQEYVSQAAAANYNQGNTGFRPEMVANQIQPPGGNFNQGQLHRPHVNQPPAYQAPIPQTQNVSNTNFESYIKANDAILRNIQSQRQRSGTLPSNTITNLKEELKGITTRSVRAPMPNVKSSIPYPSRRDNERRCDQANEQIKKFYEIFKDMSFEISFTDALIPMPKFTSTLKALIGNKEKLSEMARTPMNEHCSAVILNKLPRKLGDLGKFLNPLRCFLKTGQALIDVHKGELTLHIRNEAITYNLDQTVRYSANYNQMTTNKIDVIEMAFEEYSQEILGFSNVTASGNPTSHDDPIVSTTSPTLTLFGDSDFLLFEEADAFVGLEDDPNSPKINPFYYDPEGDVLLLEAILNSEPLPPLPNQEQYLPSFKKELKVCEAKTVKSSVDEPPEVELKDLPPHLEYAFLEGDNKLPIIIAKELGDEEKSTLIKVLMSHKRAIACKISDIQGINLEFCTHKIIMEEDYKPAVQHQRRVNPKINDVIKKEVEKLLDARLIYPISDSPWVSPVTGWQVYIDYRKLNKATRKDHFPLLFMDQMLERLAGNEFYCFLDGFSGYFQIPIDPRNQEKTTFTCPYGTFVYRRMPFGLCNAPGTFQRCMLAIFHDMVEKTMEVFMDDFLVFGNSFENCLSRLDKMLQRCEDTNLSLNWEKSHFMVKEGIFLGHKISKNRIEVDRAKVDVIAKLPHPMTVKEAPILIAPNSDLPFELMCDASDFAIENLAADHLSRLENSYENMLDLKGINETFPLETLSMVTFRGDSSAPWFADFANYHAGENRASWSDKLDDGLWAFRTAYKTPIGCTLYKLVYGKACHLSIELKHKAYWALKQANFDLTVVGDHRKV
nr:reverse transcriptase domain-containing protein [Tanacetum cinerariifolium]